MLAIAKTVADWYEQYCDLAARVGFEPEIIYRGEGLLLQVRGLAHALL